MISTCCQFRFTVEKGFCAVILHTGKAVMQLQGHTVRELLICGNIMVNTNNIPHQFHVTFVAHKLVTDMENLACQPRPYKGLNVFEGSRNYTTSLGREDSRKKLILRVHLLCECFIRKKTKLIRHDLLPPYVVSSS